MVGASWPPGPSQEARDELLLVISLFDTFDDLYKYCYKVASLVGLTTIHIFGFESPEALDLTEKCGATFQLTNILRDIREDTDRGQQFLPTDDLMHFGVSEEELRAGSQTRRGGTTKSQFPCFGLYTRAADHPFAPHFAVLPGKVLDPSPRHRAGVKTGAPVIDLGPILRLALQEEKHDVSMYLSIFVHRCRGHAGDIGRWCAASSAMRGAWRRGKCHGPEAIYPRGSYSCWHGLVINQISRGEGGQDTHKEQINNG